MTEIATTYGQALYELAKEENLSEDILYELAVLDGVFDKQPEFIQLLCTPSVPKQERVTVLDNTFGTTVHPYVLNFLKLLTEKGYVKHFSGCCKLYKQLYNKDNGILTVTVVTKLPLSAQLQDKLKNKISEVTGNKIELECKIDPEVLGGVRLDFDGKSIDGTVRHRLDEIRSILNNTVL